jgi:hypothetical protein
MGHGTHKADSTTLSQIVRWWPPAQGPQRVNPVTKITVEGKNSMYNLLRAYRTVFASQMRDKKKLDQEILRRQNAESFTRAAFQVWAEYVEPVDQELFQFVQMRSVNDRIAFMLSVVNDRAVAYTEEH